MTEKQKVLNDLADDIESAEHIQLSKNLDDKFPDVAELDANHQKLIVEALRFYAENMK
jgi:hypothetical protein